MPSLQSEILAAIRAIDPRPQTHDEMAASLGRQGDLQRAAVNMDALAKRGELELVRDGSEQNSRTKRYRLAKAPIA
jgi:hypothetical protein